MSVARHIALALLSCAVIAPAAAEDAPHKGKEIYAERCAHCHGERGEGVKEEHAEALAGDRSIPDLARIIAKTMPKDEKQKCSADEAKLVAEYISDAFYSPAAQVRNKPPRIELSRLTVRQYRNAVTDLIASFRGGEPKPDDRHGLQGEYFKSRRYRREDRFLERLDPQVNFDFGTKSPDPEKPDAPEFSMRWDGSVYAPATGLYEFIVYTEHATRLFLNDNNRPLIDAAVKSGSDTEYRESIYLLGGRNYPLRLEFSKGKAGVDDKKEVKVAQSSIKLLWKPPQRGRELIPTHCLTPVKFPETFVVAAAFPPDDRSVGYERGSFISKEWDSATTDAALETAAFVSKKLNELAGTRDKDDDREKRLREFCERFAERAFRRPLSDEDRELYINRQFNEASDKNTAVKRTVLLVLKSPRFLFQQVPDGRLSLRESSGPPNESPDGHIVAERIALALWDSLPDQQLREAANNGKLKTREEIVAQVERMAKHPRAIAKLREFFVQWLRLDHVTDIAKDPAGYPDFSGEIASDLRTSLDLFIDETITSEAADFRQLLLSDQIYINGRLAKFYGAELPEDAPFTKVPLNAGERAGVLSHPLLMSGFAYTATSSPIHRGVFVARSVLGRSLKPPPEAVTPLAPDLHADLNTRERVSLQTKDENCQACHRMINALGFPFERFDAVGKLRSEEKGRSLDVTGSYDQRSGETKNFTGVRELAEFLAGSEETHNAFVTQLFHNLVKQPLPAYGPQTLPQLRQSFAENSFNIRRLMVEITVVAAMK